MKWLVLVLSAAIFLVPAVQAASNPAVAQPPRCAGPPCGYITPIIDMEFPDKPKCSGTPGHIDLSKCIPLPDKDKSVSFDGYVRYYWKESEDLTYPGDPQQDVVISFSGVSTNPKWLPVKVEPPTIAITAVDLLDPRNLHLDQSNPSSPVVYYEYRAPIKATFTHATDPDDTAMGKVIAKGGLVEVFVKAKSSASGTYFKEGFGVESFRFDGSSVLPVDSVPNQTPGKASGATSPTQASPAGLFAPLAGLALALLMSRRRNA